jgi:hypothetical protein
LQQKFADPDRFERMQGTMQTIAREFEIDYHPGRESRKPSMRRLHMLIASARDVTVFLQARDRAAADAQS